MGCFVQFDFFPSYGMFSSPKVGKRREVFDAILFSQSFVVYLNKINTKRIGVIVNFLEFSQYFITSQTASCILSVKIWWRHAYKKTNEIIKSDQIFCRLDFSLHSFKINYVFHVNKFMRFIQKKIIIKGKLTSIRSNGLYALAEYFLS